MVALTICKSIGSLDRRKLETEAEDVRTEKCRTVVQPAVLPRYKDELLLPFRELETLNKEILKIN
jgi:hypothetical protein